MKAERPLHTFQTRIEVDRTTDQILQRCAELLCKVSRCLFASAMAGRTPKDQKSAFLKRFGITARQFNACRVQVEGKMDSVRKLDAQRILDLRAAISRTEQRLKRMQSNTRRWHGRQRLERLRSKLPQLERDQHEGRIRLCFGSKKLFRSQFNDDVSYQQWKEQWKTRRGCEFFTLGSKDETSGNQTCTATLADDGTFTLRLRLPDALNQGRYLILPGLHFAYGHDVIANALNENNLRRELQHSKNLAYISHGQAISFRFQRDDKGWRVFASTELPQQTPVTDSRKGAIGLDINSDHLALSETDRYGNLVSSKTIPCQLYGASTDQAKARIGDACARAVAFAHERGKPLIVERLDFVRKRRELAELSPAQARRLSSFAYSNILRTLRSRAYRQAVEVFDINPSFTSMVGRIKFAARYGLTTHHAAALCIARRYYGFSESLPNQPSVPDGKGSHIAFCVPVRNREKHEWQYFRKVNRKLRAALAEHFRAARRRSSDPPTDRCDAPSSKVAGETPAREPLAILLG